MNVKIKTIYLIFLMSIANLGYIQETVAFSFSDNTYALAVSNIEENINEYDDTFFEIGLATMTVFFLLVFCILIIIGVAIGTIALLTILGLGFSGILSTSVIIGLYQKSFKKGFKIFTVLGFSFCGLIFCSILFPVLNKILHWTIFEYALLSGFIIGSLSGMTIGLITFQILKALTKKFVLKLNLNEKL